MSDSKGKYLKQLPTTIKHNKIMSTIVGVWGLSFRRMSLCVSILSCVVRSWVASVRIVVLCTWQMAIATVVVFVFIEWLSQSMESLTKNVRNAKSDVLKGLHQKVYSMPYNWVKSSDQLLWLVDGNRVHL